jgi:hypothetical protein
VGASSSPLTYSLVIWILDNLNMCVTQKVWVIEKYLFFTYIISIRNAHIDHLKCMCNIYIAEQCDWICLVYSKLFNNRTWSFSTANNIANHYTWSWASLIYLRRVLFSGFQVETSLSKMFTSTGVPDVCFVCSIRDHVDNPYKTELVKLLV